MERKPGLKRKAADDLQEAQPKKLKRDGELEEVEAESPDLLKDEIDSLQRELDRLDAELRKQGDVEMPDLPVEPGVEFSEDVDDHSEIQVDDDSRGLSQSRSRRIPRPNRNFSNYEVEPEDQRSHAVVPPVVSSPPLNAFYGSMSSTKDTNYSSQPVVIQAPVRRPPTPSKLKVSRGRGAAQAASAPGGVTSSSGRSKGTGRGRGKWKPILPAPSWPIARKNAPATPAPKKGPDPMTICGRILRDLTKHKNAWVFLQPVDAKAMGLHDYHKVIKRPMDLGTIQAKLTNNQYTNVNEFAEDVRLTFRNAMLYNPPNHDVHLMGKEFLKMFEGRLPKAVEVESADPAMKRLHLEQTAQRYKNFETKLQTQLDAAQIDLEKSRITEISDVSPPLRPKDSLPDAVMEYDEKCKLAQSINTLGLRFMKGLFQIFEEEKPEFLKSESEIIDVETDRLSNTLLRRLESYVGDCRPLEQNRSSLGSSLPTSSSVTTPTNNTNTNTKAQSSTTTTASTTTTSTTPAAAPTTTTAAATSATATKTAPQTTQGAKQPLKPDGTKKEDSDESSSSSSDSSSSDDSSDDSDSENANTTDKKSKKHKGGHVTPASITITTTANSATNGSTVPTPNATATPTPTPIPAPVATPHTTIPGIAVMTPKPFILPTQKEEKQVVLMNQDSWSGLVSGGNANNNNNTATIIPVGIPTPKPAEVPDIGSRKLSSDASEAAAALASIHPVSTPIIPPVAPSVVSPVLSVPIQPIRPPISAVPSITPIQTPTQTNHATPPVGGVSPPPPSAGAPGDNSEFGGALWEDMKKRMALNKQREKDRAELEAELQRQQEEDKKRVEREIQARKQAEEERKRKEQEEERQRQLEREREVERLREEERAKREKAGPSVNLTSQSEIMANFERGVFGQGGGMGIGMGMGMGNLDVTSLLGLKRRDDDED
jgi:hypothetical protein